MMINDVFRSGGVSSDESPRIHSERFAPMTTHAVARTHIDAFRSEGFSSADSTRIHSERFAWEAGNRNEDAIDAFRNGGLSSVGSPGFTLGDPFDEA
jgi:hypothetical protein